MRTTRQTLAWILCIAPVAGLMAPAFRTYAGESGKPGAQTPRIPPPPAPNHASKEVQKAIAALRERPAGVVVAGSETAALTVYLIVGKDNGGAELVRNTSFSKYPAADVRWVVVETGGRAGAAMITAGRSGIAAAYLAAVRRWGRPASMQGLKAILDTPAVKKELKDPEAFLASIDSEENNATMASNAEIHKALGLRTVAVVGGANYNSPLTPARLEQIVNLRLSEARRKADPTRAEAGKGRKGEEAKTTAEARRKDGAAKTPEKSRPLPAANHASAEVQKAMADLRTGSVGVVARGSRGGDPLTVYLFMDESNGGEELLKYAKERNVCFVIVDTGAVSGAALLAANKFHWNSWWYVGSVVESGRPDSEEALRALLDRVFAKQSFIKNIVKTADAFVEKMKSREVADALAVGAGMHRALGTDTVVVADGVNYAGPLSKEQFEAIVKYHLGEATRKRQEALQAAMPGVKPLVIGKATFFLPTMADIVGPVPCIEKPITSVDEPEKQKAMRAIAVGPFDPVYGNSVNPELTIFVYNDYDCPWCLRFIDVMHGMKDMPPGNVRWVVKETTRSALGAMAAQKMGVYDRYAAEVRKARLDTRRLENVRLVAEKIEGLDVEAFMDLAKSPEVEAAMRDNGRCKGAGLEKNSWVAPSFTTDAGGGYPGFYSRVKMSRIIAYELWQKKRLLAGEERAPRPAGD